MAGVAEETRKLRAERVPPHNLEAEESVLGGVLLFGVFSLDFPLSFSLIGCTLASAVLGEYLLSLWRRVGRGPRPLSAVISALSVLLLFRSAVSRAAR